ncbi:hypothetical protein [Desulfovibrio sp.]|uniref:hypothetical protein n=1 Tax=Desulfovibrio sp. TaxID=885 RepID=UPI0025C6ABA8|nr:hypothetical protein [Desulfovibrio sp.]
MLTDTDRIALMGWENLAPNGTPRYRTAFADGWRAMVAQIGIEWEWRLMGADGEVVAVGEVTGAEPAIVAVTGTSVCDRPLGR